MRAIDTHSHLNFSAFDDDRADIIRELASEKIGTIAIATDFPSNDAVAKLATDNQYVWAALGLHPQEMTAEALLELPEAIDGWRVLFARNSKLVAVGEVGLDYYRAHETGAVSADQQKAGLRQLLTFAQEIDRPVIFHCRDAYGDLLTMVKEYPSVRGVVHCFSGSSDQAHQFLEAGLLLSITANITYPKNAELAETVAHLPLEKLMIETDAPFLPPQTIRGKRNDPRQVIAVAQAVADLKNVPLETITHQTTSNAREFFRLGLE
jgi:TatD DNase family protein